jgi:signal transduction histidine kinase
MNQMLAPEPAAAPTGEFDDEPPSLPPLAELRIPASTRVRVAVLAGIFGVLVVLLSSLISAGPDIPSSVREISRSELSSYRVVPPGMTGQTAGLPSSICAPMTGFVCRVTYRFAHDPAGAGANPQADAIPDPTVLYVPRFASHLEVRLDDVLVASSASILNTRTARYGTPLLISLPDAGGALELISEGGASAPPLAGPIYIGKYSELAPQYLHRYERNVTAARFLDGMVFGIGGLLLLGWLLRRGDRVNLLFGLILFALILPGMVGMFIEIPIDVAYQLTILSMVLAGALTLPCVWLFMGRDPPVRVRYFMLLPLLAFVVILAPPDNPARALIFGVLPVMIVLNVIGLYLLLAGALRSGSDAGILASGAVMLSMLLSFGDLLSRQALIASDYPPVIHLNASVLAIVIGGIFLWRFAFITTRTERFNTTLRKAVANAEAKLKESFARERVITRQAVLQEERLRLMRDLHDGIGGQLVSILAMSEMLPTEQTTPAIRDASRRALDDLRLVITSMEDTGDDLAMLLGSFRERIEPQMRQAGIRLHWRMARSQAVPGLNPVATLQILRILQEAVTNAVRHSGATTITIEAAPSPLDPARLRLSVTDDGRGFAERPRAGEGLGNMRQRAAAIGAELLTESADAGTQVSLDLPTRFKS